MTVAHVGGHGWVSPGSLLSGTRLSYGASAVARTSDRGRVIPHPKTSDDGKVFSLERVLGGLERVLGGTFLCLSINKLFLHRPPGPRQILWTLDTVTLFGPL
jgi:hypothetical protein